MTIKDLGRWESLEIVQRYTRMVSFQGSLILQTHSGLAKVSIGQGKIYNI
jgi:hypothetical protein